MKILPDARATSPEKLAHIVFKSPRYEEMVRWYCLVLNARVAFSGPVITFISYDEEHHRVAIVNMPQLQTLPLAKQGFAHVSFTYATLPLLLENYARLKTIGILPSWCVHHGFTVSLYYDDPDGNRVETQYDIFETAEEADAYIRSPAFAANPIGTEFNPKYCMNDFVPAYHWKICFNQK
jgi:2,4-dichlorophenol 6-monooxygenase